MIKLQADLSTATAKTEQISWRPTMAVVPVVWWEKKIHTVLWPASTKIRDRWAIVDPLVNKHIFHVKSRF